MRKLVILFVFLCWVPVTFAEVLVLKNGKKFEVASYEVKGNFVVFQDKNGNPVQLPLQMVDLVKSRETTKALAAKRQAEKERLAAEEAEREKIRKKNTRSMGDLVNYVEGSSKGDKSVVLSDDGLSKHTETAVVKGSIGSTAVDSGAGSSASSSGSGSSRDGEDRHQQFADEYHDKKSRLDDLDKKIKEAERVAELNEAASANNDENYSGYNPSDDDGEDEGLSPHAVEADKARARAAELRKQRDDLSSEMGDLQNRARREGVRNYERMKTTAQRDAERDKREARGRKGDRDPKKGQAVPKQNYSREDLKNRKDEVSYEEDDEENNGL